MTRLAAIQKVLTGMLTMLTFIYPVCHAQDREDPNTTALDDPQAWAVQVRDALVALQAQGLPSQGRGTAKVTRSNRGTTEDGEYVIDFVFKGPNSRMDRCESIQGQRGERIVTQIFTPKHTYSVNPWNAAIARQEERSGSIADRDFHPDICLNPTGIGLISTVEHLIEPESKCHVSANLEPNGVLNLICECHYNTHDTHSQYSFDTQREMVPIGVFRTITDHGPDGKNTFTFLHTAQMEWHRYGPSWYVSRLVDSENTKDRPQEFGRTTIEVTQFDPNADVSDDEFTFESLKIKDGHRVVDAISGFTYEYGSPALSLDDLSQPLQEAEFTQKIQDQPQSEPNPSLSNQGRTVHPTTMAQTSASAPSRRAVIAVFACAVCLIVVLGFLGYRHKK